jgi:hypothetical protein
MELWKHVFPMISRFRNGLQSGAARFSSPTAMTVWLLGVEVAALWPPQLVKNPGEFLDSLPSPTQVTQPRETHSPGEIAVPPVSDSMFLFFVLFPRHHPWADW